MAILPGLPGLQVEVVVGDSPLIEYDDEEEEETRAKTVSKYIEAATGAEFKVRYYFANTFLLRHGVQVEVSVDGDSMSRQVLRMSKIAKTKTFTCAGASSRIGRKRYEHNFRFSELKKAEDSGQGIDRTLKKALESAGKIMVDFHYVKNIKKVKASRYTLDPHAGISSLGTIPEKALSTKGLSHSTSFADPKECKSGSVSCELVGSKDSPFARFIFKYRSLARLKEMWIIRRTPSPDLRTPMPRPTPVPQQETSATELRRLEDLNKEEMLVLLRHYREKDSATPKIKQEAKRELPDDDENEISVVGERSAKHRRLLPTNKDEVIELD
ncbi:hypothetical protein K505DRAFT_380938 [Melanomma pulvis-pyrius CBS 109.77]|uniref:DUF7918 domain-containing protein n=1 Tax=Melanomma pulvis-pyrius CBS 109.77 TaxID=1314802 RepID=A0A6A6XXP7_9PLEO|nr:hypothetical protein K505DRAFT_380938 [Melanomma pulvis-pyrius CBS 109.77]